MRVLLVHPSAPMYPEMFLRLEPPGLEGVAAAVLADGPDVGLVGLRTYGGADLECEVAGFGPRAAGFGVDDPVSVPGREHVCGARFLLLLPAEGTGVRRRRRDLFAGVPRGGRDL